MKKETCIGRFAAKQDMPTVLYNINHNNGIKGRSVKQGDIVTAIGLTNDIDSRSVRCVELLYRINETSFNNLFHPLSN